MHGSKRVYVYSGHIVFRRGIQGVKMENKVLKWVYRVSTMYTEGVQGVKYLYSGCTGFKICVRRVYRL